MRWLKLFIGGATLLPAVLFAGAAWLSYRQIPDASHRDLALFASGAFVLALVLALVSWGLLRRTQSELSAVRSLERDSAQRSRAEQQLLQSQKLEALGRLTGGVAHDFNNLLMIINNNAYLLKRGLPSGDPGPQVAAIERAVEAGTKLMRQLLAFSRTQAVHPEVLRLQDAMPSLVDLMRPALGAGVTVKIKVDDEAAPVRVDRAELELAMLNLAVNAADAMTDGGAILIELKNARGAPGLEGDFVTLSVTDQGGGIPEDVQERVFEPFFTTKPVGKGTGLGLSQVYGFCQQSGGTAVVESKVGQGTTVRMYLRASAEDVKEKEPAPSTPAVTELPRDVLLVEDNDEVAKTTKELLEFLGCEVKRVESGNAAVLYLEREAHNFDLVLSDIVMPGGLSGIEVLHYIREHFPYLAVVLMTGYSSELQKSPADAIVLLKPFSPQQLADAMREALARQESDAMGGGMRTLSE